MITPKPRHVFAIANQFTFRLTLCPGLKFVCEERFNSQAEAAEAADLTKFFLVRQFGLKGSAVLPSLSPADFAKIFYDSGIDPKDLKGLFTMLPHSFQEFVEFGNMEAYKEYIENEKQARVTGFGDIGL